LLLDLSRERRIPMDDLLYLGIALGLFGLAAWLFLRGDEKAAPKGRP
jgi:hypothetical protein